MAISGSTHSRVPPGCLLGAEHSAGHSSMPLTFNGDRVQSREEEKQSVSAASPGAGSRRENAG